MSLGSLGGPLGRCEVRLGHLVCHLGDFGVVLWGVVGTTRIQKWASRWGAVLFLDISVDGCLRVMLGAREEGRTEPQGPANGAEIGEFPGSLLLNSKNQMVFLHMNLRKGYLIL